MPRARKPLPPIPERARLKQVWRRCRAPACRTCAEGQGHGPYWCALWDEYPPGGKHKARSVYLGATLSLDLALRRFRYENTRGLKHDPAVAKLLRAFSREVDDVCERHDVDAMDRDHREAERFAERHGEEAPDFSLEFAEDPEELDVA